jgi:integrase/recombinase XerD
MREAPLRLDVSLEQATDIWLARYASANTRAAYSSDLRAFLSWLGDGWEALAATPELLTRYRTERESAGVSATTLDRQFAALRAFYAAACEFGVCASNPLGARPQAVTTTSATTSLTADEVALLEAAAAADPRTTVLVQLLLGEGMRLAEILALDHADVTGPRNAKRLRVIRHGGAQSVELDRVRSHSVVELQRTTRDPGPLFVGPSRGRAGSTRLTRFGADHLLKVAANAAGIERVVSANVLRRTHVTNAEGSGVPIDDIRRRMGHRDVRTTRRYLTPPDSDQPTHSPERS